MKHITLIAVVVLVLGGGFFIWQRSTPEEEPIQISNPELEATINNLRRLKTIQLDTSLFEDPFFASLALPTTEPLGSLDQDGSLIPFPTKQGRPNPFLPF